MTLNLEPKELATVMVALRDQRKKYTENVKTMRELGPKVMAGDAEVDKFIEWYDNEIITLSVIIESIEEAR